MLSNEALLKKIQGLDDVEKAIIQSFIESSPEKKGIVFVAPKRNSAPDFRLGRGKHSTR